MKPVEVNGGIVAPFGNSCPGTNNTPLAGWNQLYNALQNDDSAHGYRIRRDFTNNYSIDFACYFNAC